MSHKSSFTLFCKDVLTVTSLSVIAAVSVPSQVLSLTTQIADIQDKTVGEPQQKNYSFINQLTGEESNFLLSKKDKDDDNNNNRRRGGDDDDDDDDDDRRNNRRRYDNDDDRDNYRRGDDYRGGYHRSSKLYRIRDWNCFFKVGRLVNSNRKALVIHLDILEKPVTKYANVVYTVYARQNNRWVQFYSSTGSRLIEKKRGKFSLTPEVIEFNKLRVGNLDWSRSDLRFVTEIRYDSNNKRDQRLVFEDVWNYSSITEISSISQLTTVSYRTTKKDYDDNNNYRRRDDDDDDRRREYRQVKNRYSSKAFRSKDWNCLFKLGRLVNSNQRAFVLHLDILEKPVTKYANVVYTIYARQNNRWVQFYNSTGARQIAKKGKKYFLTPEVIEFNKLRLNNIDLSKSEIKFVTEIRYDSQSRREERLVFENSWNYNSITEINSISQLDIVSF
ncbi:hypothetical protein [Anabaena lutea]|uniref:F5/8 type C domain-containing protein n=1 Tax=Anabaena lutea FACHB-196 TaxID=2692881 RepID=A0ABR8FMZ1_9NOST|nr:hypothetical protein [Anabaena lutea]MBD2571185.1 hypothetical protein [Anabaena lutea FACHB-196]